MNDLASASISRFAESGHAHALEEELSRQGPAIHDEFHLPKIAKGEGSSEGTFFLDGSHTMVSFITKIVPSPDWFVGLDSYNVGAFFWLGWVDIKQFMDFSAMPWRSLGRQRYDRAGSIGCRHEQRVDVYVPEVANESAERDREDHRSVSEALCQQLFLSGD